MGLRMDDLHAPTVPSGPTSRATPNGIEKSFSLQDLTTQKEKLEAELSALSSVLDTHQVDMNTPLLTPDGFPRADIDVAQIRTTRARIIRLKNDYKEVMARLEGAVQEAFASGKTAETVVTASTIGSSAPPGGAAAGREGGFASSPSAVEPPFARVNTVAPNGPAHDAGLKEGDKIVRVGDVNWTNHERLGKVAHVVQRNEGRSVVVKLLRETSGNAASTPLELRLTPRRNWGGTGLLGCHLLPL